MFGRVVMDSLFVVWLAVFLVSLGYALFHELRERSSSRRSLPGDGD